MAVSLPKLWNHCCSLEAKFRCVPPTQAASQMSEVKACYFRSRPLCSITWYLLRRPVNKHRCTTLWVRQQPKCNRPLMSAIFCLHKGWIHRLQVEKTERWGQCKDSVLHPGVWEVISAEWELFHPQLGFFKCSNSFVMSKMQLFDSPLVMPRLNNI